MKYSCRTHPMSHYIFSSLPFFCESMKGKVSLCEISNTKAEGFHSLFRA